MQKWEYCSIEVRITSFTPKGPKYEDIKRDKAKGDRNDWDAVQRRIAQLGLEGWELVCVYASNYYFKRPLPEAGQSEG